MDTSGLNLTSTAWDGITVDVSWYIGNEGSGSYTLSSAAQLAGAAALVNGLVNSDCKVYTGSEVLTASAWNNSAYVKNGSGSSGSNNRSTDDYSYGIESFKNKTINIAADFNMSAGNYMPLGGQYLMTINDDDTKIDASFSGVFDGNGHTITIQCDRHCSTGLYGDGQSVGLIGRLGVHDNDDTSLRPSGAAVKNVVVKGSVHGNRSVGGIVGKIGKTDGGATIENCANFASVSNTDAKGVGGIVGAGWNGGVIRNCYNAGTVSSSYSCPTGGISGSNEITIQNCYNIGQITAPSGYAMAIGTNNGGAGMGVITNCFYLEGTAADGGYYTGGAADNTGSRDAAQMKSDTVLNALGSAFVKDTNNINMGYPVMAYQNPGAPSGSGDSSGEPSVIEGDAVKVETKVEDGKVTGTVNENVLKDAVSEAIKAIEDAKENGGTDVVAEVKLDVKAESADGVKGIELEIPAAALKEAVTSGNIMLTIESDVANITFDASTLAGALDGVTDGETLKISAEVIDNDTALNERQKERVGDNPVISLSLLVGSTQIHDFNGSATVTIPYTPPTGHDSGDNDLLTIYYMDSDGNIKELKDAKYDPATGTISFTTTHFSVFFISEWISPFVDVQKSDWFYKAMRFAYSTGLMNGVSGTEFSPNTDLTRAMLVTILYRHEGEPAVTGANPFSDVADGQWYTNAIIWANENSIVDGYGGGLFGTNASITREQIATILYRYTQWKKLDSANTTELSAYSDAGEISSWALDAMKWANAEGLITGRTETTLSPKGTGTRAEVAAMLMRFIEKYAKI